MKKQCVIKPHHAGLFSLINNVLTCLDIYEHVHVDWSSGCIYGRPCDGNIWNHLFRPTEPPVGPHSVVKCYPRQDITYKNVAEFYRCPDNHWRVHFNRHWNSLGVSKEIQERVSSFEQILRPCHVISVLVRANCHGGEQVSERSQELEEYGREIEKLMRPNSRIYVAARDTQTLAWFSARFPTIFHPETKRCESRDIDLHLAEPQSVEDAKQAIVEVMLLSKAEAFIHPVSNMATAALYINPEVRSIYLP